VGWMIVETANVNAEDGIEKHQWVKLKLQLGSTYVYEAEFMVYDVKGFDIYLFIYSSYSMQQGFNIVLGKR
jgi:hypothetical protein